VNQEENVGIALSRVAGAPLVQGNRVRLLKDAAENYPAWLEAIRSAKRWVHFESYIIHQDEIGHRFADLLAAKAREGVRVRLIYDWLGAVGNASWRFWRRLSQSGADVRCFNRPSLDSPFGWVCRDHRKMISVDGEIAYISGLCVGNRWVGYPDRGIDPWRDTGVEIQGPAVIDIERAFAEAWAATGPPLPEPADSRAGSIAVAGDTALRIVASVPNTCGVYRLDQLMAALAQQTIWLADAYFIGTSAYVQTLRAAAMSGVDVRLLVPGVNDVPVMRALSRAGFRPLLEAGVRVFEWNGPMMHAKTAVVDGRWSRVGSTNLNPTSWLNNWELDVIVEDERFSRSMEEMYLDDLSRSTEIVLDTKRRPLAISRRPRRRQESAARQAATGVMRLGNVVGAAITNRRELGPAEAMIMAQGAAILAAVALVATYWPKVVTVPIAVLCTWMAISLAIRAYKLRKPPNRLSSRRRTSRSGQPDAHAPQQVPRRRAS
jgi:cardiolipin synthase